MKVAVNIDYFNPLAGGAERWTALFAHHLLTCGYNVHVLAFGFPAHDSSLTFHLLPPVSGILARARIIKNALIALVPDISYDAGIGLGADLLHPHTGSRLLSQARLVATHNRLNRVRAAISPRSIRWRREMAVLERMQMESAQRVVAVSDQVRNVLAETHPDAAHKIEVIRNGVDTERFAPARIAPLRAEARRVLGLGDSVTFLGAAHNMRLKGMDTAIRALGRLRSDGQDVRLVIAGGEPDADWHRLAGKTGVADRVHFVGNVPDITAYYAAADAFVHPTRWDACSLSTIEAATAGLPVITTAMNGAAELIADGRTGFVLPDPEDVTALTDRMRCLLRPDARHVIGQAACQAAQAHTIKANLVAVEQALLQSVR